ncbi:MAG: FtsX-like permease family protein [Pseudomonadota bacterium]
MLKGFFKDKLYLFINSAGLALAMTVCTVLGLYLRTELSYDRHHLQHDRIYRVATEFRSSGRTERVAGSSMMLGPTLVDNFSDVQAYVRFRKPGWWETGENRLIKHGNNAFYWDNIYLADPNVFSVFTHEIVYGNPETALVDPSSVAVSATFARRYFGDANPLGEVVMLDDGKLWTINLVFADLPANTHLKYDVLFSYNSIAPMLDERARQIEFFSGSDYTYLLMPDDYDVRNFDVIAQQFYERFMAARGVELHTDGWNAWLQPLLDIHLHSDVAIDQPTGNLSYLLGLEAVTIFILLIACMNYINLSTARVARRAREIGMRKVLGGSRRMLVWRFLGESVALSSLALVASLLMLETVLPLTQIAVWLGQPSLLLEWRQPGVLAAMAGFSLMVGMMSGVYPAFYLSSLPVTRALNNADNIGKSKLKLREFLVVFQFGITVAVLCCVFIMQAQMQFIADKPLGFEEQGKIMVTLRGTDVLTQIPVIESELENHQGIADVSHSDSMLGLELPAGLMDIENNDGAMEGVLVRHLPVAPDFIDVAGMEIVEGRNLSADIATDRAEAIIVNETLVHHMGWSEALGKKVGPRGRRVIGVVKDFNFQSLHLPVEPLVMYHGIVNFQNFGPDLSPFKQQYLLLDVNMDNLAATLEFVSQTIRRFDPAHPFDYRFINDAMNTRYQNERDLMQLTAVFAGICIFIACLGLFGLATFATAQRTKEIGIRKVLGSGVWRIVLLLTYDFSKLVLVANLIAWPIAYVAMTRWLENFAYRVDLTPLVFIGSGLIALCVAWVTVGGTAARAASVKPVLALRHD